MASLTYVCFVPAKGLIRDLSADLQRSLIRKVSDESLGRNETFVCKVSHNYPL